MVKNMNNGNKAVRILIRFKGDSPSYHHEDLQHDSVFYRIKNRSFSGGDSMIKLAEEWKDGWIDYPGVGKITDQQVAELVYKHTTLFDRIFRPKKIVISALLAQNLLMKVIETPKGKWRF